MKDYMNEIICFFEGNQTILFIFGPSGCGKTSLIKMFLSYYGI